MRICAPATSLHEDTAMGGGFFHVKNLQGLADLGVRCLIPLAFRIDYQARRRWEVRTIPLRRTFKLGALLANVVFFFAVLWQRLVRGERFDLVRIGDLYHFGPGALLAARLCRRPTVGMIHHVDEDHRRENAVVGWTARRLDGITVPSRATALEVERMFGVDPRRLHVIVEGASVAALPADEQAAAKKKWGLGGKQAIGFLGRLDERKNVSLLIEAFARIAPAHPQAVLLLGGDGPQRAALAAQAQRLGVTARVVFAGRIAAHDKARFYRALDLFAFPSKKEGFGLAVVDAMAVGVPVIVSDRGSLPEVVENERTGRVVPIDEPQPLADAIAQLLGDADLRRRWGAAAKRETADRFTWEQCARDTLAAYRRVLVAKRGRLLGVLLNSGDSLAAMKREGQHGRFIDHYLRRYVDAFEHVSVFSYGDETDEMFARARFVPGKPRWKGPLYAALMPLLHRRIFREVGLLRVMQTGAALPAVIARALYGTPLVLTYGYRYGEFMRLKGRRLYGWWLDVLERLALPRAERVIVTTPALRDHVARFVGSERIAFIPNGVDLSRFAPQPRRRKKQATALFVGRLTEQKNLPLAIAALGPLAERVRLVCVGAGEQDSALSTLAEQVGLSLELTGPVPHEKLPEYHRRADLFVLPSRIEGHPKALVEAMASGLPCVGADVPGIRDVIVHEENGLLVAPEEAAFRAAVERLLDDPALARALGKRARATATEQYDLERLLDREIELLRDVVEGN